MTPPPVPPRQWRRAILALVFTAACAGSPRSVAPPRATPEDASAPIDAPPVDITDVPAAIADDGPAVQEGGVAMSERPACPELRAQDFLIRERYLAERGGLARAIRYRTERYGYFPGFGSREWNPVAPMASSEWTTFMGLRVRLHRRVLGPLRCVEAALRHDCAATPYQPTRLQGIRGANSFRGGEASNHVYGIALDIDPQRNPCCGCGRMFRDHPGCRPGHPRGLFDRMAMPECWVRAFERHGFYWLGDDQDLRDMMHFEFLADPAAYES